MKAIGYKMSPKQVQHGTRLHEDKIFQTLIFLSVVLVDLLFVYAAVSFLSKPVTVKTLWRQNKNRESAPMSDNRTLQLPHSDNSTKLVMRNEQVKICSRFSHSADNLRNDHRISAVQKQKKNYVEFVYCVATKLNRSVADIVQEVVSGNGKVVDFRIGSGRQKRTNVARTLLEAVREADHAISSGMLPIITIRMNPKHHGYVNRIAQLMELEPCREAMIKACVAVCDATAGAC